ncbi:hypothetical protein LX15_004688 [Streptoalloteichus tenebrarius]|uniref:Uncharacterized protein n=1 Tax=Streptoalloteichus tenebrarius (strain ATCC 17920 / DSM 40477 / JCM 4838 / CBS 697.72 / NBRC 16177 / NCIMB 11028 / NRRL B-12390 / A12253. 1 / ISP 5477) TaxID=1933 RepID=A0ABT1HZL1_STRSD|nr:hypothetical protein [Streptoalloteichus tenebrarius]MCP2260968.1 hypothetical protein [Streptoalloteichus tenebrarius]BFE98906.1 hypothetical protein GCM10020241_05820 [Streptoalloteichus tenebrarius]
MPAIQSPTSVTELPPYRAMLVVDVKDFSGLAGRHHAELTDAIPGILQQAFLRCGLAEMWDEARFPRTTGDGHVLGFRAALLPFLINPFLGALQDELDYRNTVRPLSGQEGPIRMRVSINVGPVTDSGGELLSDGSGTARIETHRLLDSQPVRDLLARSSGTTCVAAIISARAFEDAVLSGYAADDPDLYVPAPVEVKRYQGTAYLRVPKPSGDLLRHGFRPAEATDAATDAAEESMTDTRPDQHTNSVGDVDGSVVQAREYHRHGGVNIGGNARDVITDARGPVITGTQHHTPQFYGDGVTYTAGNNSGDVKQRFENTKRRNPKQS